MKNNPIVSIVLENLKLVSENDWVFDEINTNKAQADSSQYIFSYHFLNTKTKETFDVSYKFNNANPLWFYSQLPRKLSDIKSLKPFRFDILLIGKIDKNANKILDD